MDEHNDKVWRNLVNSYQGDFPSDGSTPPSMENIKREEESIIQDGESPVILQKIVTEVYVITSMGGNQVWGKTQSFQNVQLLGDMRLSEALQIIETAKKRRRRRR